MIPWSAEALAKADYTLATWGERQAERYLSDLQRRFQWLAEHPNIGRTRDDIGEGFRSQPHGAHVIFYLIEADHIAIIGVPHRSMDIEAYFKFPE